ncbi:c2 domain-containing protein [Anaeramoeba flamelloides]|uniref:C2 domain-containing protein n=1 Tax=Anaeramoeba flamelloides TaxID=1746091 RepID=A0ABQ8YI17_9EUKA|nr:c2 domain-containing protein [Anaeramoeba flamelloides]
MGKRTHLEKPRMKYSQIFLEESGLEQKEIGKRKYGINFEKQTERGFLKYQHLSHSKRVFNIDGDDRIRDLVCSKEEDGDIYIRTIENQNVKLNEEWPRGYLVTGLDWDECGEEGSGKYFRILSVPQEVEKNIWKIKVKNVKFFDLFHTSKFKIHHKPTFNNKANNNNNNNNKLIKNENEQQKQKQEQEQEKKQQQEINQKQKHNKNELQFDWRGGDQETFGVNYDFEKEKADNEFVLLEEEGLPKIVCSNCYSLIQLDLLVEFDIDREGLNYFNIEINTQTKNVIEARLLKQILRYEIEKRVVEPKKRFSLVFSIGPIPIYIDFEVGLDISCSGELIFNGNITAGIVLNTEGMFGATYTKQQDWQEKGDFDYSIIPIKPSLSGSDIDLNLHIGIYPVFNTVVNRAISWMQILKPYMLAKFTTDVDEKCNNGVVHWETFFGMDVLVYLLRVELPVIDDWINPYLNQSWEWTIVELMKMNCSFCEGCVDSLDADQNFERIGSTNNYFKTSEEDDIGVYLTVERGNDLENNNILDKIDPYINICIQENGKCGKVFQTSIKDNTLNPVWNEKMFLGSIQPDSKLLFKLYDDDLLFDDFLGEFDYQLNNCGDEECSEKHFLKKSNEIKGEIEFKIEKGLNHFFVEIINATNLIEGDYYIEITRLDLSETVTSEKINSESPIFNEIFKYSFIKTNTEFNLKLKRENASSDDEVIYQFNFFDTITNDQQIVVKNFEYNNRASSLALNLNKNPIILPFGTWSDEMSIEGNSMRIFQIVNDNNQKFDQFQILTNRQNDEKSQIYLWDDYPEGATGDAIGYWEDTKTGWVSVQDSINFYYIGIGTVANSKNERLHLHLKVQRIAQPGDGLIKGFIQSGGYINFKIASDHFNDNDNTNGVDPNKSNGLAIYAQSNLNSDPDLFLYDSNLKNISLITNRLGINELMIIPYNCYNGLSDSCYLWDWGNTVLKDDGMVVSLLAWLYSESSSSEEMNYQIRFIPFFSVSVDSAFILPALEKNLDPALLEIIIPNGYHELEIISGDASNYNVYGKWIKLDYECKLPHSDCKDFETQTNDNQINIVIPDQREEKKLRLSVWNLEEDEPSNVGFNFNLRKEITSGEMFNLKLYHKNNQYFQYTVINTSMSNNIIFAKLMKNKNFYSKSFTIYGSLSSNPSSTNYNWKMNSIESEFSLQIDDLDSSQVLYFYIEYEEQIITQFFFQIIQRIGSPLNLNQTLTSNLDDFGIQLVEFNISQIADASCGVMIECIANQNNPDVFVGLDSNVNLTNALWFSSNYGNDNLPITKEMLIKQNLDLINGDSIWVALMSTLPSQYQLVIRPLDFSEIEIDYQLNDMDIQNGNAWISFKLLNEDWLFHELLTDGDELTNDFINSIYSASNSNSGSDLMNNWNQTVNKNLLNCAENCFQRVSKNEIKLFIPASKDYYLSSEQETLQIKIIQDAIMPNWQFTTKSLTIEKVLIHDINDGNSLFNFNYLLSIISFLCLYFFLA